MMEDMQVPSSVNISLKYGTNISFGKKKIKNVLIPNSLEADENVILINSVR